MTPVASPRHPWKALAVVLLVFAAVHGAGAHASFGDHETSHIRIVHADRDCPVVHIDVDDEDRDDDPDDEDVIFQAFDDDDWS
jgi:hypothetical protein